MARIFPHQLLVLLSLLSSSCSFLSRSAHAPNRQTSFRSRHAKHGITGRELFNMLKRLQSSQNQSDLKLRTNGGPGGCGSDPSALSNPNDFINTPDTALRSDGYGSYVNSGLDSSSADLGKYSGRHTETASRLRRNENTQEELGNDDDAFRYRTAMPSIRFAKSPRGPRSGVKKPSLEYVSQHSRFPWERTLQKESMFWGPSSYSDGPGSGDGVPSPHVSDGPGSGDAVPSPHVSDGPGSGDAVPSPHVKAGQESDGFFPQLSKHFPQDDTLGVESSEETVRDFELRKDTEADTHFQIKEFTDGHINEDTDISLLKFEDDARNIEAASRMSLVLNSVGTAEPDDETTGWDGGVSDQNTWSSMTQNPQWVHRDSLNRDGDSLSPEEGDEDVGGAPGNAVPTVSKRVRVPTVSKRFRVPTVSKRFRMPLHKKVFFYGQDDRLKVFLPQMRKFPFSNIARLSTGCTGTLVTPRHVLTAAHCVHNGVGFRNNLEKLKIEIPDTMGFKDYYAQKITIPTGWLRENRSKPWRGQSGKRAIYDYAVVRLKLGVAGRTKFLPLAVPRPEVLQMDFHFLAFPQHDQQLWRSVCLASQHMALGDGNLIMTRCDAAVGNSGAAVFIKDPHGGMRVVGILSNTMHVGHHRSFYRYSIITALTWPKLTDICQELGALGRKYNVCPPVRYMRRSPNPPRIKVIPFFGKRSPSSGRRPEVLL